MKRIFSILMMIIFAQPSTAQYQKDTSIDGVKYRLAFKDEFDGQNLNKKRWNYRTDSKHWSTQLPKNVTLNNGYLYLNIKKEKANKKENTGAGIISKRSFELGYYEARFKIPPGAGWHTSFWLMLSDGSGGTGTSRTSMEFDICENDSKNKNSYGVNFHNWKAKKSFGGKTVTTPNLADSFHIWGCEIRADKVSYYFDGELVQSVDAIDIPQDQVNIWLTTIASSLGKTTAVDDNQLPSASIFDYVRYYKLVNRKKLGK